MGEYKPKFMDVRDRLEQKLMEKGVEEMGQPQEQYGVIQRIALPEEEMPQSGAMKEASIEFQTKDISFKIKDDGGWLGGIAIGFIVCVFVLGYFIKKIKGKK